MSKKLIVIAIGGNSLIEDNNKISFIDQYKTLQTTCKQIVEIIKLGYNVVITHGNGPQVGFELRRCELSKDELPYDPIDVCVAKTQGTIGYAISLALLNELKKNKINREIATIITKVLVDKNDHLFKNPSKPIGSFITSTEQAETLKKQYGWIIKEDAKRGFRRVVPSPLPIKILDLEAIKTMMKHDIITIAVGGGGIPVYNEDGEICGIEAVIDKDLASSTLAQQLNADIFLISTAVEYVTLNFKKDNEEKLKKVSTEQLKTFILQQHFAEGSMLPKINAIIEFVEKTKKVGIITNANNMLDALFNKSGTLVTE